MAFNIFSSDNNQNSNLPGFEKEKARVIWSTMVSTAMSLAVVYLLAGCGGAFENTKKGFTDAKNLISSGSIPRRLRRSFPYASLKLV